MTHLARTVATLVLALGLTTSLGACSKVFDPGGSATAPVSTDALDGTGPAGSTGAGGSGGGDPTTAGTPTSPAPVRVDQGTPEAALTSWLSAMVAGQGDTVCRLMATKGRTISSIPGATRACGEQVTPKLEQFRELRGAFTGLSISGATVEDDRAGFESVTTEPAMVAELVSGFEAVRIKGKWYVTQG